MSCEPVVLAGKKAALVRLLAQGATLSAAAVGAGVGLRTAQRYMQDPLVRVALAQAQDAALGDVARRMSAGAGAMLDVLQAVAADVAMPPSVRVAAARTWLETMFRAKEMLELSARVAALEAKLGGEK